MKNLIKSILITYGFFAFLEWDILWCISIDWLTWKASAVLMIFTMCLIVLPVLETLRMDYTPPDEK